MGASDYFNTQKIGYILGINYSPAPTGLFWSLHASDPLGTGVDEMTTQVSGRASYAPSAFTAINTNGDFRRIRNTSLVNWGNALISASAYYWGLWDAAIGGNFLFSGRLEELGAPTALTFAVGDPVTLGINAIAIELDILFWSIFAVDNQLNWIKGITHPSALSSLYLGLSNLIDSLGVGTEITSLVATERKVITSAEWTAIATVGGAKQTSNVNLLNYGNSLNDAPNINNLSLWTSITDGDLIVYPSLKYSQTVKAGKPIYILPNILKIAAA